MDNEIIQRPVLIRKTESKERHDAHALAAIVQAASKQNSTLSSVWYRRVAPRFSLAPDDLVQITLLAAFGVSAVTMLFGVIFAWALTWGIVVGLIVFVWLIINAYRHAETTEYEISYESASKTEQVQHTYRVEVYGGNSISYVDLPAWFTREKLQDLHDLAHAGVPFNIHTLVQKQFCTQQQFPELRENFSRAGFLEKRGKSWHLAQAFFQFAESEISSK